MINNKCISCSGIAIFHCKALVTDLKNISVPIKCKVAAGCNERWRDRTHERHLGMDCLGEVLYKY